jgi:hypothetical protein
MKPLADYTPDEALAEILSLVDTSTENGHRVDMLAGHLMLLALNAERRYREHVEADGVHVLRGRRIANDLRALIGETQGRKTVQREQLTNIANRCL